MCRSVQQLFRDVAEILKPFVPTAIIVFGGEMILSGGDIYHSLAFTALGTGLGLIAKALYAWTRDKGPGPS